MESKLKAECQDSVGEIPTYENLLLREGGYPHLPTTPIKQAHVTNIWMKEKDSRECNALRIDFSNGYHIRVVINGFSPDALSRAFRDAAMFVNKAERNGSFQVKS